MIRRAAPVAVVVTVLVALFTTFMAPPASASIDGSHRVYDYDVAANNASARSIAASRPSVSLTVDEGRRASVLSAEPSSMDLVVAAEAEGARPVKSTP